MLANENTIFLFTLLIALLCVIVVSVLYVSVFSIIKIMKKGEYAKLKMILLTVISIIIAGTSWIFNMGWIRFILTIMLLPFIHAIIFFITNFIVSKYITNSGKLKILSIIFFVSYLITYVLLPDGGDDGGLYLFFGLIHNDMLAYVCEAICTVAIVTHITAFILQIIHVMKLKREIKLQNDIL